ncbi:MAG: universal stress protein [Acidobacteria bacterium]|nr:universal stress protein [Acidobacteriota bacterium]
MNLRKIVVATDFSEASQAAVETAFSLTLESGAILYLLHVMDFVLEATAPMVGVVGPSIEELYREEMQRLQELIPQNWKKDVNIETAVLVGTAASEIASFAREKEADLIVVGTHGRTGLARVLMGSTAEGLLRQAPCQVLVVKPKAHPLVKSAAVPPQVLS